MVNAAARPAGFSHRDLLGIEALSSGDILQLLDEAAQLKKGGPVPVLRGRLVVNLFFEASTRTRASFEIAAKRLDAETVNWTAGGLSVSKGETLVDTAKNLEAMGPAALVIRHAAAGAVALAASRVGCSVIDAGDGAHEHPSQALLDAFTLRERWGRLGGKTVAIVGDIAHSRVARSNVLCLTKLGASVRLCGPPTLMPKGIERLGERVQTTFKLEEALRGADAVMLLRIQLERLGQVAPFPSLSEYARLFGLGPASARWLAPEAVVLHPGPINRGVELASVLADGDRSLILDQVENGVAVRMAILKLLLAGASA